ncbi:hypothetical protein RRG08_021868 [Elysia crispata]|uniref:Uncharacterized protein n=1 Tax=Elysia crispata TaxID=231223 RepID=A0AAE0XEI9_9GAST|nr:hypothetical protein RRG08_021868 [Elysia crispata]
MMKPIYTQSLIIKVDQNKRPLPSHTYSILSRGDPAHTTSLTQQQLQDAHAKLYHPRNARSSTLGHLPLESHLEFIDSSLVEFSQIEPSVGEPHEQRWKKPVSCECNIYHGLICQLAQDLSGQHKGEGRDIPCLS